MEMRNAKFLLESWEDASRVEQNLQVHCSSRDTVSGHNATVEVERWCHGGGSCP